MKRAMTPCLSVLMLLATTSGADDKQSQSVPPKFVRVEKCKIALLDHVKLASDRSGILKHVEYKEGDTVGRGNRVVLIADEVAIANLDAAQKKASNEVEIKFAMVSKDSAEKELEIMNRANEAAPGKESEGSRQTVAQMEVIKAKLAVDKAKLSIEQARHELALNKLNALVTAAELKTYSVLAEFDGVVTKIYKKKGEAVKQGEEVADIVNTDRVRVEGRIKLNDLRYAKQGSKVFVRLKVAGYDLPGENEVFEGKITFVDLVSDAIKYDTRIYAEVKNRDNILRAGLSADMEIEIDEQPVAAVIQQDNSSLKVSKAGAGQ